MTKQTHGAHTGASRTNTTEANSGQYHQCQKLSIAAEEAVDRFEVF